MHYAVYQFADQARLNAAMNGRVLRALIADFDKNWPSGVTRSRDKLVNVAEERVSSVDLTASRRRRSHRPCRRS